MDCSEIYQVLNFITKDVTSFTDPKCMLSPSFYGNPLLNKIQEDLRPQTEEIFGKSMLNTYTYFRQYRTDEVLTPHKDRPSCEYSITLCMGYDSDYCWPIFLKEPDGVIHKIELESGDCLFYKGMICEHWRKKFKGKTHVQAFFHYVDKNGKFKKHIGDKIELDNNRR